MSSLQVSDTEAAAVAKAPRVALADIEAAIAEIHYTNGRRAAQTDDNAAAVPAPGTYDPLAVLTICILVMRNGFTIIGKSAPASPKNFDAELGRRFAYEDAVRQLWPLMGFALRDKLAAA
jgi:hypothetical protein